MNILITGGLGYIGSHLTLSLLANGYKVIIIDDLSNSSIEQLYKIETISNKNPVFIKMKIHNKKKLIRIFKSHNIEAIVHLAGFKSIIKSYSAPSEYHLNNVIGTKKLLEAIQESKNIKYFIFSSSATVYDKQAILPWTENTALNPLSPYALNKKEIEKMLCSKHLNHLHIAILRYFNPIGAHHSGLIGEDINFSSTNLINNIGNVLLGKKKYLRIYGVNHATLDGSCVRDFIHINDLVDGHVKSLRYIKGYKGVKIWNLGSGVGHSVFEVKNLFEKISGFKVPFKIYNKRKGDVSQFWANASKAEKELNWRTTKDLKEMITDSWNYMKMNN